MSSLEQTTLARASVGDALEPGDGAGQRFANLDLRRAGAPGRSTVWYAGLAVAAAWAVFGAVTRLWPNRITGFSDWAYTSELGAAAWVVAAWIALLALTLPAIERASVRLRAALRGLRQAGPWLFALPLAFTLWEILTAKTGILPTPFFAPPQALIEVYHDDWARLVDCVAHSLGLLAVGFVYGGAVGFLIGVSIGWSRAAGYWVHPVMRVLGPVPATALLPLAFYIFPSSRSAAIFLVALATAFPVTVLTWSGVASVNKAYYDVARTLGASPRFLVLRVAIPAALPQVFVGLFMGLSASFTVLVTAEMMGVKSGLGWYLTWAQGWASYTNMYAALLVMAVLFSGLISLLFLVRDRTLVWQKGTVKW